MAVVPTKGAVFSTEGIATVSSITIVVVAFDVGFSPNPTVIDAKAETS